ncbi:MAG: hypothetical protein ACXAEU_20295 [Candidatus Hodarchaeales archaeon]|jgi:Leucine-rich repeat (LRR) protein/antitoxin component of MazEF toxin-antitoxin module
MDDDFEFISRKIIKVGNSYAVAIAPSKASRFGFDLGTRVKVELRNGMVIITREGESAPDIEKQLVMSELTKMDAIAEQPPSVKADEQNLQGLDELSSDLGNKSLVWVNQRVYGYNSNLRLGEKRRRVIIRRGQVITLNIDLMTIPRFPESINGANFPSLRGLRLSSCKLTEVDLSPIETILSLEKLVLSKNDIDEIDLSPLSKLNKMNELSLDGNLLDHINLQPLKDLSNIETINLSSNELEEVDLSPLSSSSNLKELYLDNNFLTDIDLRPLSKTKGLHLSLENNPIDDIDLEPLFSIDDLHLGLPDKLSSKTLEQVLVLQEKGVILSVKPTKRLTTGEIFNLPHNLQETALTMLSIEEGTVEDIAKEIGKPLEETRKKITSLQKMGYIGMIQKEGKTVYYPSA